MVKGYVIHTLSPRGHWGKAKTPNTWGVTVLMLRSHPADSVVRVYAEDAPEGSPPVWEGAALDVPDEEPGELEASRAEARALDAALGVPGADRSPAALLAVAGALSRHAALATARGNARWALATNYDERRAAEQLLQEGTAERARAATLTDEANGNVFAAVYRCEAKFGGQWLPNGPPAPWGTWYTRAKESILGGGRPWRIVCLDGTVAWEGRCAELPPTCPEVAP